MRENTMIGCGTQPVNYPGFQPEPETIFPRSLAFRFIGYKTLTLSRPDFIPREGKHFFSFF